MSTENFTENHEKSPKDRFCIMQLNSVPVIGKNMESLALISQINLLKIIDKTLSNTNEIDF